MKDIITLKEKRYHDQLEIKHTPDYIHLCPTIDGVYNQFKISKKKLKELLK